MKKSTFEAAKMAQRTPPPPDPALKGMREIQARSDRRAGGRHRHKGVGAARRRAKPVIDKPWVPPVVEGDS